MYKVQNNYYVQSPTLTVQGQYGNKSLAVQAKDDEARIIAIGIAIFFILLGMAAYSKASSS